MTRDEVIAEVQKEFGNLPRPKMFIRGTCYCDECIEHEKDMQAFSPDNLPLDKLGNPGWDPISFASDEAFAYFLPGLVRIVLDNTDDYVQQFIFHLGLNKRIAALSERQCRALIHVLDFLVLNKAETLDNNLVVDDLFLTKEKLKH